MDSLHDPTAPRVSIIIVSWNALHLLKQFLPGVVATDYPNFEVVLADNASSDGSSAWVAERFPTVRIVRHPENWGFCRGNNEAIRRTSGDFVVLLNNDVRVDPGWLQPLVRVMERRPDVGALQPKLVQMEDTGMFEYAGAAGGYLDALGYPFARGRIFFTAEPDRGQYDEPADIFWATGAAMMLRRTALDRVGLLDERFHLHMEEIDLCWRLQREGYRILGVPDATLHHLGGGTLPQGDVRKVYYNFRNSILMLYKNLPPSHFRRVMAARVALDTAALARSLAIRKPAEASAIVRGYRDALQMLPHYKDERPDESEDPVLPNYRGSIVLDYFLRGKRYFSDLDPQRFRAPRRPVAPHSGRSGVSA